MRFTFQAVAEDAAGETWQQLFRRLWPSYQSWYLSEGDAARPSFLECERSLHRFLPEMVPIWERLVQLAGGGDLEARFLSLYCPPPYVSACSQAAWVKGEPMLVRNYDYSPKLCEGIILRSAWQGSPVLASTDCLIGAIDGINQAGLCVSLSFGGKETVGPGFGAPLLLRYILEFCATTRQAAGVLSRVPTHMAYNILVLDASGDFITAFTGPGAPAQLHRTAVSTNHQQSVSWPRHAQATATVVRQERLLELIQDAATSPELLAEAFLKPPLHSRRYGQGLGTLYTAVYHPRRGTASYLWPSASWSQSLSDFQPGHLTLELGTHP